MAPKYCRVKKDGSIGKVLLHDPQDSSVTWKLEIDGRAAWFAASAVLVIENEAEVTNAAALTLISQDWAYVSGLARSQRAETYAESVIRMRAGVKQETGGYGGAHLNSANTITFEEMALKQAGILDANTAYIEVVIDMFDELVKDFCRCGVSAEYTDLLAIRIRKEVKIKKGEVIDTAEFKMCMLPALRAMFPGSWDARHEEAWTWLWDTLNAGLQESLPKIRKFEKCGKWVEGLGNDQLDVLGKKVWSKLFSRDPEAEAKFVVSRGRLVFIATSALRFSARLYREPLTLLAELEGIGLKHSAFGVHPKNFDMFVKCMHEEVTALASKEISDGVYWALQIVAMILGRSVIELGLAELGPDPALAGSG